MTVLRVTLALALVAFAAAPALAADATLMGTPSVSPTPLAPGKSAEVLIGLRAAGKGTQPVRLEVRLADKPIGQLSDVALGPNQSKTYRIGVVVPASATGKLDLLILGWGVELARVSALVQAPATAASRAASVPSLTQTVMAPTVSVTGDRGTRERTAPVPSLTQTVTAPTVSVAGNRGTRERTGPVPSLTQSLTTPTVSTRGNR